MKKYDEIKTPQDAEIFLIEGLITLDRAKRSGDPRAVENEAVFYADRVSAIRRNFPGIHASQLELFLMVKEKILKGEMEQA